MQTEGEHRFTNGIAIDEQLDRERVNSVLQHEFAHNELYTMTTFGQMLLMLEKNALFHDESEVCKEVLFAYTNRMQERTAVNIEIIEECTSNGMAAYNNAIERLRERNRNYYNYFRKLCCINGKIKTEEDAKTLANVLMQIAKIAMNVRPELIPINRMKDAKKLRKYFDDPQKSAMISPNKRFDIMVNSLFRENDNNNDIDSVFAGTIDLKKLEDYSYIHDEAFKHVSKFYKDSEIGGRLIERLRTIGVMSFTLEGANYLSVKPVMLNEKKEVYIKPVGTVEELISVANLNNSTELFVAHTLGGFEELHAISVYGIDNDQKIMYTMYMLNQDDFFRFISTYEFKYVFYKTKLFNKVGNAIRKMVRRLPIYIYEDSPMLPDLPFLESYFVNGEFGFVERMNKTIFVIRKRSVIYMADIVSKAKDILVDFFSDKNIRQIKEVEKMCNIEEVCRIDEKCNEYEVNDFEDAKLLK